MELYAVLTIVKKPELNPLHIPCSFKAVLSVFSYILSTDSEISAQKSLTTAFNLWRANSLKKKKGKVILY